MDTTTNKIEDTDASLVFEWVKTGHWTKRQFLDWFTSVKNEVSEKIARTENIADLRCDVSYCNGLKAGFDFASNDDFAGYNSLLTSYQTQISLAKRDSIDKPSTILINGIECPKNIPMKDIPENFGQIEMCLRTNTDASGQLNVAYFNSYNDASVAYAAFIKPFKGV